MTCGSSRRRAFVLLVLALLVVAAPTAVSEDVSEDALEVSQPLSIAGIEEVSIDQGAVHYQGDVLPATFSLQAEQMALHLEWRNGSAAGAPGNDQFVVVQDDRDRSVDRFSDVTIRLESARSTPEVVLYPDGGSSPTVQAIGTGAHDHGDVSERYLTRVGQSPETESEDGDGPLGFWYQPSEDWIVARELDEARTTGNFSLFVNNVTVVVEQEGETVWRNWTGYQEQTQGPGARTFQRQLLEIRVRGGASTLKADDGVHGYGAAFEVESDGVVSAPEATGRLELGENVFSFDEGPLRMEGEGTFRMSKATDTARPDPGLRMDVAPSSSFIVRGGGRIEPTTSEGVLDGFGLEVVGVVGVLGVLVAARRSGLTEQLGDRWRSSRYAKWMARGRELSNSRDHAEAARCFRRATEAQPAKGVAWYHLAVSVWEDDRPDDVLDVIDEARRRQAIIDELDFLELEAQAALQTDDRERCRRAMEELADGSPRMARRLVSDLHLGRELLGDDLASRLVGRRGEEEGEDLPGYV